jgi:hypothetical protein
MAKRKLFRWRRAQATAAAMVAAAGMLTTTPAESEVVGPPTLKQKTFYVALAHADDEIDGWSMLERRPPTDYVVWVLMTHGRTTLSCETAEEASSESDEYWDKYTFIEGMGETSTGKWPRRTGPYRYQGPNSPVNEPNLSESDPYGDPWQGLGTDACGDARVASWHWFLDGMSALTPNLPSMDIGEDPWADDDFRGEHCPPGRTWNGASSHPLKQTGCVDVWADENGARVVLDLPEMPAFEPGYVPPAEFTAQDVADALRVVRAKRGEWGIPVLPEAGIMSGAMYAEGLKDNGDPLCEDYNHPEHKMVADAVRYIDMGAGPQYGVAVCDAHPYLHGAEKIVAPQNPATVVGANLVVLVNGHEHRVGPYVKHYGWLLETYGFDRSSAHYYKVFD